MKYVVVEIDLGNGYEHEYYGIECLKVFMSCESAKKWIDDERQKVENIWALYNENLGLIAKQIFTKSPESAIVALARRYEAQRFWNDETFMTNKIRYLLHRNHSEYKKEYNLPDQPRPKHQFIIDILEIPE